MAVNAITPGYQCENCLRGYTSQSQEMLGGWKFASVQDGNLSEYFHVNSAQANLAPIPATLTDEQAAYCSDMMSTGFMGAEHANIPIGGTVAIFAQGPVGLMATAGARLLGAGLVIAVESVPQRKQLAKDFGADVVIDFTGQDPTSALAWCRVRSILLAVRSGLAKNTNWLVVICSLTNLYLARQRLLAGT